MFRIRRVSVRLYGLNIFVECQLIPRYGWWLCGSCGIGRITYPVAACPDCEAPVTFTVDYGDGREGAGVSEEVYPSMRLPSRLHPLVQLDEQLRKDFGDAHNEI